MTVPHPKRYHGKNQFPVTRDTSARCMLKGVTLSEQNYRKRLCQCQVRAGKVPKVPARPLFSRMRAIDSFCSRPIKVHVACVLHPYLGMEHLAAIPGAGRGQVAS